MMPGSGDVGPVSVEPTAEWEAAPLKGKILGWDGHLTLRDYINLGEAIKWCLENSSSKVELYGLYRDQWIRITNQYAGRDCVSPMSIRIWFKDKEDAMAFKLRWL